MAEGSSVKRKMNADKSKDSGPPKKTIPGHWSMGLMASMEDPDLQVDSDDKMVIIKDKYPKAKFHFLVMPRVNIPNLKSLKPDHLDLLKHFEKKGREIAEKSDKNRRFRFGYHAVPSMSHLHMHVISQDFDSPSLKNKKHWNSFTTEYFVDSSDIIKKLEKHGKVEMESHNFQNLLKEDLRCHVCKKSQSNIPALKSHIKLHDYYIKAS